MVNDVIEVKGFIPKELMRDTIIDIKTTKVTTNTHGFHKYPGKFIPQIPRWAIEKYLENSTEKLIMDPFCGSGTTLVEGLLKGHNVIGVDIDPLSTLISKVKTTSLNIELLNLISDWFLKNMERVEGTFIPECETLGHWFTEDATIKLSKIRTLINMVESEFGNSKEINDIKDFLIICFSSIIRRVSNADNQSQKTYVSGTKPKIPEETFTLFRSQLALYRERIQVFSSEVNKNSTIICGSNINGLAEKIGNVRADLAITSPPYIKSVDYVYNQMAELFWVGDLFEMQTQELQNEKKKEYIGTNKVAKVEYSDYSPINYLLEVAELDEKLQEIFSNDTKNGHKHAFVTYKYFIDMEMHFQEMINCLESGSHYVMVVGDSTVSDVLFRTSNYLIEIAQRNGFRLVNKWGYKIKNHFMGFDRKGRGGKIEIDWVIDFIKI